MVDAWHKSDAERLADIQDRLRARKFISEAMTTVMHALDAALRDKDAEIAQYRVALAAERTDHVRTRDYYAEAKGELDRIQAENAWLRERNAALERETIERCASLVENGRFLHDQAPGARLAKEAAAAIRALEVAPHDGWQPIETASPPRHQKCLFLCSNGEVYMGAPCYGMHPPWWCADGSALKETVVLNDTLTVTHWRPIPLAPRDGEGA